MSDPRATGAFPLVVGLFRLIPAVVLAGFFAWTAVFIRGNGGRPVDWFGPALLALLCGLGAVGILIRTLLKSRVPVKKSGKGETADAEPAFDADAAIKRYLESKASGAPADGPVDDAPAPRPTFGRRRIEP